MPAGTHPTSPLFRIRRFPALLRAGGALAADRRGTISVLTGLALTLVMGFASLGVEVGLWQMTRRGLQGAADQAALSGAIALGRGETTTAVTAEAKAIGAAAGYADGQNQTVITVNTPPASGPNTGNGAAVEVITQQTLPLLFSGLFLNSPMVIQARSVAGTVGTGAACILGLDTSAANTVSLSNNALVPNPSCGVVSNSTSASALVLNNNARINSPVAVVGQYVLANNAVLAGSPNLQNAAPASDPYAGVQRPTAPPCTSQTSSGSNNAVITLSPGHFCSGLNFRNNVTLNLNPGAYYIDSQLAIGNNVTVNATGGVTLIIQGNYAIDIGNNAVINITAPSSGTFAGLAFFGDRNGTSTVQQTFANNTQLNIKGAVYFPNQIVEFDNNAETAAGGCTQIIGRMVHLSNNVNLESNCSGVGTTTIPVGFQAVQLE